MKNQNSLNASITLAPIACKCGNKCWELLYPTQGARSEICAYCRSIKYLNLPHLQDSILPYEVVQVLLLAEYQDSTDKITRDKIMSTLLGNKE